MATRSRSPLAVWLVAAMLSGYGATARGGADAVRASHVASALTVVDGLPVNATTALRFGPQGHLWIATWDGLARFDGVAIETYRSDTHPELPSNRLIDLAVDADGVLWLFAEDQSLARLVRGRITAVDVDGPAAPGAVLTHRLDARGRLWLGASRGVFVVENGEPRPVCVLESTLRITDLAPISGEDAAVVGTRGAGLLRCDDQGASPWPGQAEGASTVASVLRQGPRTWWMDDHGLHREENGQARMLQPWTALERVALNGGRLAMAGGRLWVRTVRSVFALDLDEASDVLSESPDSGWIPRFAQADAQGRSWVAHGRGLYLEGAEVARLDHHIKDFELARDGSVWVATDGGGVLTLRERVGDVFAGVVPVEGANLYAVAPSRRDPGRLWLGGIRSGLITLKDGRAERLPATDAAVDDGTIWTLLEDSRGRVWQGGTILCLRRADGRCEREGLPPPLVTTEGPGRDVRLLLEDASGAVWIGSGLGLYRYRDGLTERINTAPLAIIRSALLRRDGSIWFGSNGAGLFLWRDEQLLPVAGDIASLLIRSLHEDADGVLWVGSENRGLLRLQIDATPAIVEQRQYGPETGLWDNVIHHIAEDRQGRLWMNSNRGIFWIEREMLNRFGHHPGEILPVVGYTEADGLLNREGNGGAQSSGYLDAEDRLWLPGQSGLVRIDTARQQRDARAPLPVIERARIANGPWQLQPEYLEAASSSRDLELAYAAALFRHGDRARFRYRLVGYDADWREAGGRREAYYTNLPAGDYLFQVMAASADGVWSESPAQLSVAVAPRVHERAWFQVMAATTLLLLGALSWRWRLAALKAQSERLRGQVAARTADLILEQRATEDALAEVARQAEQLRELDVAKSRFFTHLSHELRTPLTLIVGPAGQAEAQIHTLPADAMRDKLRAIRDNGERLLELVNQIQALALLEAGYRPLKTAPGDLVAFCRDLLTRFTPLAGQRGVALLGPPSGAACVGAFDHDAMDKILANLLGNALRHSPAGGVITLALRRITGGVVLSVADQGPGIPPERLERVFERFYSADHEDAGSGIGLALARELAHLHGGDLSVQSRIGEGCTFRLVLSLDVQTWSEGEASASDSVLPLPATSEPMPALADAERTTVLVAEDQPEVRRFVVDCLAPTYRVLAVDNGRAALEAARRELPDVVVSDVMMPEMDGMELVRRLGADAGTRALPVILLTARSARADELDGLDAGAVDYLTKPFAPELLLARVRRMLGFAHRLREQVRIERAERARLDEHEASRPDLRARLERVVLSRLDDESLDVETLASALHMSRSRLKRAMTEADLPPPSVFIRERRLVEAAALLRRGRGSISEVAYAVGFASLSHFTRRFREHFGATPSAFIESQDGRDDPS